MRQSEREVEAPLHPARIATDLPVRGQPQADALEELVRASVPLGSRDPVERELELEMLAAGQERVERGLLKRRADRPPHRRPLLHDPSDRFCGSFRLSLADGTPIAHDQCWMALAIQNGKPYVGQEIVVERPDGGSVSATA